jgi:hypothetical protein
MSRHRAAVTQIADSIGRLAKWKLDDDLTREMLSSGIAKTRVVPFSSDSPESSLLRELKAETEEIIRLAHLEDFRDAEIAIEFAPRERVSRCVAGSYVVTRRLNIVDVRIKAVVRTRWVHPISETEFTRQWVVA